MLAEEQLLAKGDARDLYMEVYNYLSYWFKHFTRYLKSGGYDGLAKQRWYSHMQEVERAYYGLIEWGIDHDLQIALDVVVNRLWPCWIYTLDYGHTCNELLRVIRQCRLAGVQKPPVNKLAHAELVYAMTAWLLGPSYGWFEDIRIDVDNLKNSKVQQFAHLLQYGIATVSGKDRSLISPPESSLSFLDDYADYPVVIVALDVLFSTSSPHAVRPELLTRIEESDSSSKDLKRVAATYRAWNYLLEQKYQLAISQLQPAFEHFLAEHSLREIGRILIILGKCLSGLKLCSEAAMLRGIIDVIWPEIDRFVGNVFDDELRDHDLLVIADLDKTTYDSDSKTGRSLEPQAGITWIRSILETQGN